MKNSELRAHAIKNLKAYPLMIRSVNALNERLSAFPPESAEAEDAKQQIKFITAECDYIASVLDALDEEEKAVVEEFFFCKRPLRGELIGEKLGYCRSNVYRIRDEALRKICCVMFGEEG